MNDVAPPVFGGMRSSVRPEIELMEPGLCNVGCATLAGILEVHRAQNADFRVTLPLQSLRVQGPK